MSDADIERMWVRCTRRIAIVALVLAAVCVAIAVIMCGGCASVDAQRGTVTSVGADSGVTNLDYSYTVANGVTNITLHAAGFARNESTGWDMLCKVASTVGGAALGGTVAGPAGAVAGGGIGFSVNEWIGKITDAWKKVKGKI